MQKSRKQFDIIVTRSAFKRLGRPGWLGPGAVLEKILGGVSGLHLPSKECELNVFKPKLFVNHFSSYIRRTTSDFGGHGSN